MSTDKIYTKKKLCQLYDISYKILRDWLTVSGLLETKRFKNYEKMRRLTPAMVEDIFEHFGDPER